ncbi:hypothetical protein DEU56DRAFT_812629 [Suillus clintonianus]|uniref:uncharacterized protein n=1 Tax=Suillus clintonianus TaxID=1904413 RepID=UPI001B8698AA|nr:uncharacterized protein DEU56DRAFT_812629 [Suillus clintonianus]KAG2132392.1 hypothetical protein DEU56DRAFT_812629 [Suillus clintonianus]
MPTARWNITNLLLCLLGFLVVAGAFLCPLPVGTLQDCGYCFYGCCAVAITFNLLLTLTLTTEEWCITTGIRPFS